jgi:hypothetical protein
MNADVVLAILFVVSVLAFIGERIAWYVEYRQGKHRRPWF